MSFIGELTADVILLRHAESKGNQLEEFLKHPSNQSKHPHNLIETSNKNHPPGAGLYLEMTAADGSAPDDESEEEEDKNLKVKNKQKTRKRNGWYKNL